MPRILVILLFASISFSQPVLQEYYYGGIDRSYYLYIPDTIESQSPLVFVFHGYTGSAAGIMGYSGINDIADENGFAVCYPQGVVDDFGNTFFNVGYSFHWNETVDDVGFVISLAQYLQSEHDLSSINTFSTGMSNGGDLSYLLACEASTHFRAVAPIAGIMMEWVYETCEPERPMPLLEVHGNNDNISWWYGDIEDTDGWGPYVGVDAAIELWRNINNCDSVVFDTLPDTYVNDGSYVVTEIYQGGINNNEVWLYKIVNGGHDWPGAWGNMDINASELAWEFFNDFSLSYEIGDVDFDGQLTISDILFISDQIQFNLDYDFISDHNHDDSIDINDVFSIIALIFGYG
mgnify:FL=1